MFGVIKYVYGNMRMPGMEYFKEYVLFCAMGWDSTLIYPLYIALFVTELLFLVQYGLQLHKADT